MKYSILFILSFLLFSCSQYPTQPIQNTTYLYLYKDIWNDTKPTDSIPLDSIAYYNENQYFWECQPCSIILDPRPIRNPDSTRLHYYSFKKFPCESLMAINPSLNYVRCDIWN